MYARAHGVVYQCSAACIVPQVVKLREMFPHGPGFVLVFDYMLSDLSEVIRNPGAPLTEVCPW